MKKTLALILILTFTVASLASCNNAEPEASSSVAESSTPESSTAEESGSADIVLDYEIPEFDMEKVLYCDKCTLQGHEENAGEAMGISWLIHNYFEFTDTFGGYMYLNKDEIIGEKYIYVAFMPYQKIMEYELGREEMCEILKAFGFVESAEAVELMDTETRLTATAGYFPMVSYHALRNYLKDKGYSVGLAWLSEDCIANKECRYYELQVG